MSTYFTTRKLTIHNIYVCILRFVFRLPLAVANFSTGTFLLPPHAGAFENEESFTYTHEAETNILLSRPKVNRT